MIESLGMRACEIPTHPREGISLVDLAARLDCCKIKACLYLKFVSTSATATLPQMAIADFLFA